MIAIIGFKRDNSRDLSQLLSIIFVNMQEYLKVLGFNGKEIRIYLALLENGEQPASFISKKLSMPKATALFILHRLRDHGYLRMRKKEKTEYFFADPSDLERAKSGELEKESEALKHLIPLLKETKNPLTSPPKLSFFEGVASCKVAYGKLLESTTEILEFATHEDLAEKFGEKWMDKFIATRAKRKIFIRSICHDTPFDRYLVPLDKKQQRATKFISEKNGKMFSCIDIYEDKLLILNLSSDAFGILIENSAIVETMKTIHRLAWNSKEAK